MRSTSWQPLSVAVAIALPLAGCGGGSSPATPPSPTTTSAAANASTTTAVVGQLPHALHDGAGATVGGTTYFLGGAEAGVASTVILRVSPSGASRVVGHLPAPASDVSAAATGSTVYVVGGFTECREILRFDPATGHVREAWWMAAS
jgi:hypothetical protein